MSYYKTTNISGEELKQAVARAKSQTEAIRLIFLNTRKPFSPSQILGLLQKAGHNILLTSVRRSISDLTEKYPALIPQLKEFLNSAMIDYLKTIPQKKAA